MSDLLSMKYLKTILTILLTIVMTGCSSSSSSADGVNGIYYWRTTLSLNDAEREFMNEHDVVRMYLHFFDVEGDKAIDFCSPQATLKFKDSIPEGIEVVPTVYISQDAINCMQMSAEEYAEKILRRVTAMCRKNNIQFNELQLDCDWTKRTQPYFYKLCESVKELMDSTQSLSSTIRLHQLTQTPPPVDKGVLMVYNTGNLMATTTDNSIFSYKDIEPYLRDDRLSKYALPLDVAYPTYGWSVVYSKGEDEKYHFYRLMQQTDFTKCSGIHKIDDNLYEAEYSCELNPDNLYDGSRFEKYRIKVERPTASEILKVKNLIDKQLRDKPHSNILYHLDQQQLSHYTDNEISKIYSRD